MNLLMNFSPNPILLSLGPVAIHWYGLVMAISIALAFWVTLKLFDRYDIPRKHLYDLGFYLVIFGFIGARVYHVLNEIGYYWHHPAQIIAIWNGGLAIHGGLIAGVIVLYFYIKKHSNGFTIQQFNHDKLLNGYTVKLLFLLDILSPGILLSQGLGRWGNFFNQELYGMPSDSFGIFIEPVSRMAGYEQYSYFLPAFFIEFVWDVVLALVLLWLHKKRITFLLVYRSFGERGRAALEGRGVLLQSGTIFAFYLIFASLGRIIVEFLRIDPVPLVFSIRLPLLASSALLVIGVLILVRRFGRLKIGI